MRAKDGVSASVQQATYVISVWVYPFYNEENWRDSKELTYATDDLALSLLDSNDKVQLTEMHVQRVIYAIFDNFWFDLSQIRYFNFAKLRQTYQLESTLPRKIKPSAQERTFSLEFI